MMDYLRPGKAHVAVVVCPINALMEDQVRQVNSLIPNYAAFYSSTQTDQSIIDDIHVGKYSVVFCSPESWLGSEESGVRVKSKLNLRETIAKFHDDGRLCLVALDECHLLHDW
jgi:superfamily II DNA helicase RecQ